MQGFLVAVASAVVAGGILWLLGVGRGVKVSVHGSDAKKTGKRMVLIAWAMIIGGAILGVQNALPQGGWDMSKATSIYSLGLIEIGVILLVIGSIVAWFQKN